MLRVTLFDINGNRSFWDPANADRLLSDGSYFRSPIDAKNAQLKSYEDEKVKALKRKQKKEVQALIDAEKIEATESEEVKKPDEEV